MADEGDKMSRSQLSRWFEAPRRTLYYKPTKSAPKVNPVLAKKVKGLIDELPFAGYRTIAFLLGLFGMLCFAWVVYQMRVREERIKERVEAAKAALEG